MGNSELVIKAARVATAAHKGQKRRNGRPYIVHPAEVSRRLKDPEEKAVAFLHDVIEDTPVKAHHLRKIFPETIVIKVLEITRRSAESYEEYQERMMKAHKKTKHVKEEDIRNNFSDCKPHKKQKYTIFLKQIQNEALCMQKKTKKTKTGTY